MEKSLAIEKRNVHFSQKVDIIHRNSSLEYTENEISTQDEG